jgi:hypothetical protein
MNEGLLNRISKAVEGLNNSDRTNYDVTEYITGTGNHTVGTGIYNLDLVILVGGGGGGRGGDTGVAGTGGGSGALIYFKNLTVEPGKVLPYTVGAGGAGGASGSGAGADGGDTTFGSASVNTALTANGGKGGTASAGAGGVIVPASVKLQNEFKYNSFLKTELIYRDGQAGGAVGVAGGALALDADALFNFIYAEEGVAGEGGGGAAGFLGPGGLGGSAANGNAAPDRGGAGGGGAGIGTYTGGAGANGFIYIFNKRVLG